MKALRENPKLNQIFERKDGKQVVMGRGNRMTPTKEEVSPLVKPLHEIRSVQYEDLAQDSAAARTVT